MRGLAVIVLLVLNACFISGAWSTTVHRQFKKVPVSDVLPSNTVVRIFHDSKGFMWFGTKEGLCRFDGYSAKVFRSNWRTPSRLSNNSICCIAEDKDNLWVGTDMGVNFINKSSYNISQLSIPELKKLQVNTILIDREGVAWIGTSGKGIFKVSGEGKLIANYRHSEKNRNSIGGDWVTHIYQDRQGRIWSTSWICGLSMYQPASDNFFRFPQIGKLNNPIRVFQDKDDQIWVCTWGDGIFLLDPSKGVKAPLIPVKLISNGRTKSVDSIVYSIAQDETYDNIWVVSLGGLFYLEKKEGYTWEVKGTANLFDDVENRIFHDIIVDRKGNLWLGSEGEGVYRLDFNRPIIRNILLSEVKQAIGALPNVTKLCESADGKLITVVNRVGIFIVDPDTGTSVKLKNSELDGYNSIISLARIKSLNQIWISSQGQNGIYITSDDSRKMGVGHKLIIKSRSPTVCSNILEDSHKRVWVATNTSVYFKSKNSDFVKLHKSFTGTTILQEDMSGGIWIVCEEGIFRYRSGDGVIESKIAANDPDVFLSSRNVQSVCCRSNGDVCVGTREGQLFVFTGEQNSVSDLSKEFGIVEDAILDVVEDGSGVLWISTAKKIIRYNPTTHASSYFMSNDGIIVNSFSKDAIASSGSGLLFFGGNRGISVFSPSSYTYTKGNIPAKVSVSDIYVQGKSIFDQNGDDHFDPEKSTLTLKNDENNFGIEFSSLDFSSAGKIQYAYMLEGVDKDWIYVGNSRRLVSYANLPSGSYVFKVKASDENDNWNGAITALKIVLKPPFYSTWWAFLFYFFVLSGAAVLISRNLSNRIKLKNELRISSIEKQKAEELVQLKLHYFTNISHELLTPLTIITLLVEKLQQRFNDDDKKLEMVMNNVNRLRRLIQQILAFKKSESGDMKLRVQKTDILALIRNICKLNFYPMMHEKDIRFKLDTDQESYVGYCDVDKLDKILYNLLSNAVKYTPKGGDISVKVRFVQRESVAVMVLSVSDSGCGIPEEELPLIFKRFYIGNTSDQSQSHGIGLSLTYDLVQLHKGHIRVNSLHGEGAVFTFELPISVNAFSGDEVENDAPSLFNERETGAANTEFIEEPVGGDNDKMLSVLVAEDNAELRKVVVDHFSGRYKVFSAENGVKALQIIQENEVDLLITDVMMPEMDGLTLCQLLRNDIYTSHIGIVMLTAKNAAEDRVDCYNAGADAFISKPFEMQVLEARVKNLISKKVQAGKLFKTNVEVNISDVGYTSIDEVFLKQAVRIVECKLSDFSFDFEQFAIDVGASKSTLYRKLKTLTGMSPGEFIRNIRLKHAAKQLMSNAGNISEVAYSVGFNDSKYFSRSFKAEFGVTPSEYRAKQDELNRM